MPTALAIHKQESSRLLDHRGQPVRVGDLDKEFAAPTMAGIRNAFYESIASGLTPYRLGQVLSDATRGEDQNFLTYAEEMEERDPHYASVLGIRKATISGLPIVVEAVSNDARDVAIAEELTAITKHRLFETMLFNSLDALGKGYSMVEIMWNRAARNREGQPRFMPSSYEYRDPRHFQWDRFTGQTLRIRDETYSADGRDVPAFKFIQHRPLIKSGLAFRGGLARLAAAMHILKSYGLKDWMALAEIFGIPLRIGRFTPSADKEGDVDKLVLALAELGARGTVAIPKSMDISVEKNTNSNASGELFSRLLEYLDKQMSKAVLGQTMSTDDGSSLAQAQVHNEVRGDIRASDAKQLSGTINRDFVEPYVTLNFPGPHHEFPEFKLIADPPEDRETFTKMVVDLAAAGVEFEKSWVRDKVGAPEPEEGSEVIGGKEEEKEGEPPEPPKKGEEPPAEDDDDGGDDE